MVNHRRVIALVRSILFLAGSFTFALLLGEMVHEWGHFLAHMAYGNSSVGVILNPFGGSRMTGVTVESPVMMATTSMAGPLLNICFGICSFLAFRRHRVSILFPLSMSGAVAFIQEGVTLSLGLLTPGGDADFIVQGGVPVLVLLVIGIFLVMVGVCLVAYLLPQAGVKLEQRLGYKLAIVSVGMCSIMLLRALHAVFFSKANLAENVIPLVLSVILAVLVSLLHTPVYRLSNGHRITSKDIKTQDVIRVTLLGGLVFAFQLFFLN